MCDKSLSVWFVCRLCRGSFGQVDAFIEHKKEKHFPEFQNTTSIVFEESEQSLMYPVITNNGDHQLVDEINHLLIKTEVMDDDPINPISSRMVGDLNFGYVEYKREPIGSESEINAVNEDSLFGLEQPEHNPYVLLKRLTSEEIQSACFPQHNVRFLKFKQENLANSSEPLDPFDADSSIIDHNNEVKNKKSTKNELPATVRNISAEDDLQFECKLCSKQLASDAQLKIHTGICALYHEDRKRYCVLCNRKFAYLHAYKGHHVRFHGTVEEKSRLYKFKCHVCHKKFQQALYLSCHLETHKKKEPQVETSKPKPRKCSHPNCGKRFRDYSKLHRHFSTVHLDKRPFICSFPNCNKTFKQKPHMERHFMIHTGERPFKCTVANCNKAFITSQKRSIHQRSCLHRHT